MKHDARAHSKKIDSTFALINILFSSKIFSLLFFPQDLVIISHGNLNVTFN